MAPDTRIFELRTYIATPGRFDALVDRFRDKTRALFERHGMTSIGYWVATDDRGEPTGTLIYLLAHASREVANESWESFAADPDWIALRDESDERLTASFTSVFLDPTSFSPLR